LSDIRANTISDAAGTGPIDLYKQSAAKAWVSFTGTGTVTIQDSFEMSSIADRGVGLYTVNFSSTFDNALYACTAGSSDYTADGIGRSRTTTSSQTENKDARTYTPADSPNYFFVAIGDLA